MYCEPGEIDFVDLFRGVYNIECRKFLLNFASLAFENNSKLYFLLLGMPAAFIVNPERFELPTS